MFLYQTHFVKWSGFWALKQEFTVKGYQLRTYALEPPPPPHPSPPLDQADIINCHINYV